MDKHDRKQMLREWRNQQRSDARAKLPLPPVELRTMFAVLDVELRRLGCNRTRRLTKAWLESLGHDVESVFRWLDDNGGFCDCEVLANSKQYFEEAMQGAD